MAVALAACGGDDGSGKATEDRTVSTETEKFGKGDIGILNYALTVEYLEAAFYGDVVKRGLFKGAELGMFRKFGDEEDQHVATLTAAVKRMGGTPAPAPKTRFNLKSAGSALETASELEELSAAAYLGQLTSISSRAVLASVLSIHSVEGRHAAAVKKLTGESITQFGALESALDVETVLKLTEPFVAN